MNLFFLWVLGCSNTPKIVTDSAITSTLVDADGDGFYSDEDCDDEDAMRILELIEYYVRNPC